MLSLSKFLRSRARVRTSSRKVSCEVQQLEVRTLPAGTVTVNLTAAGNLSITGDSKDNVVNIEVAGDVVTITGEDGTKVKVKAFGETETFDAGDDAELDLGDLEDGINNITVSTGSGDDEIEILVTDGADLEVAGNITVNLGAGNDSFGLILEDESEVTVEGNVSVTGSTGEEIVGFVSTDDSALTIKGNLSIDTGAGKEEDLVAVVAGDTLGGDVGTVEVNGNLSIKTGGGDDALVFGNVDDLEAIGEEEDDDDDDDDELVLPEGVDVFVEGNLNLDGGAGDDVLLAAGATVENDATINGGDGLNEVALNALDVGGDLSVKTGKNRDIIGVLDTEVGGKASLDSGKGSDNVVINGLTFNGDVSVKLGDSDDDLVLKNNAAGDDADDDVSVTIDGGKGSDRAFSDEDLEEDDNVTITSISFTLPEADEEPGEGLNDVEDIEAAIRAIVGDLFGEEG